MMIEFDYGISLQLRLLGVLSRLGEAQTSKGKFQWKQRVKAKALLRVAGCTRST